MPAILCNIKNLSLHWYSSAGWVAMLGEKAEQERQRAERLAECLRSQGVDSDRFS
jgi:hypothetical protein